MIRPLDACSPESRHGRELGKAGYTQEVSAASCRRDGDLAAGGRRAAVVYGARVSVEVPTAPTFHRKVYGSMRRSGVLI
jgi:hypothetical protein